MVLQLLNADAEDLAGISEESGLRITSRIMVPVRWGGEANLGEGRWEAIH